jgi:hypothetical protein
VFSFRSVPRSGVRYALILEWFLAARWAGLDWFSNFNDLDGDDMAFVVAAYRTNAQIEAVTAYYAQKQRKQ